jgi:hypothetical protein
MMVSFDLYRSTPAATEWVGSFLDLDLAKAGLTEAAKTLPGLYTIVDQSSGELIFSHEGDTGGMCPLQ